jgi:hypothetical protein
MAKRGRPSLIEADLVSRIAANVAIPIPFKYACEREGVNEDTGYLWMRKGHEGDPQYEPFYRAITRARADAVKNLVTHTINGGRGSKGAEFQLERQYRHHFGPTQRLEHTGADGGAIAMTTRNVTEMSDEELMKIVGETHEALPSGDQG